jgi:hypothetical protein
LLLGVVGHAFGDGLGGDGVVEAVSGSVVKTV